MYVYCSRYLHVVPNLVFLDRFLRALGWLLVQPLLLVAIIILTYTSTHFPEDPIIAKAMHAFKEALTFSFVDYAIYGNWMLSVGATFLFPTWFLLWVVVLKRTPPSVKTINKIIKQE